MALNTEEIDVDQACGVKYKHQAKCAFYKFTQNLTTQWPPSCFFDFYNQQKYLRAWREGEEADLAGFLNYKASYNITTKYHSENFTYEVAS